MAAIYKTVMIELLGGRMISRQQAADMMGAMMDGALEPAQSAAFLTALAVKGVTAQELAGLATAMRSRATPLPGFEDTLDTCGTGGSGLATANVSTMCAFVLAEAGIKVAKHGNRSSSGKCGSADVLEHLGVHLSIDPHDAATLLRAVGMTFLFAPSYHPAMRHVVPVRRTIGFRTVFNFLGPLCNPARSRRQLIGVSDPRMAEMMAFAMAGMGCEKAIVAHGEDGLDELSLCAPTRIWRVAPGSVTEERLLPTDLGLQLCQPAQIAGGDVLENARIFEAVLSGADGGPHATHLALNVAAALEVAGVVDGLAQGLARARALLASGRPWRRFCAYRNATQAIARAA